MLGTQGTTIHAVVCQELKKAACALVHSAHMLMSPSLFTEEAGNHLGLR